MTQALAWTIWVLGLAGMALLVGAALLTSSRTGLEVSPLPGVLYAVGLALALAVAGLSAAIPRLMLSDERLIGLVERVESSRVLRQGAGRLYLASLAVRSLLGVALVALGFAFVNETLTAAPIMPFAGLALVAQLLALPRPSAFLRRVAELEHEELDPA